MHKTSEFGVAAHWDYKLKGKTQDEKLKEKDYSSSSPFLLNGYIDVVNSNNTNDTSAVKHITPSSVQNRDFMDRKNKQKNHVDSLSPSSIIDSYIDALDTARSHLLQKNIFIFLLLSNAPMEEGKVLSIPFNSSVADALLDVCEKCLLNVPEYYFDSDTINNHISGDEYNDGDSLQVFINGHEATLNTILKTGDTLVVLDLEAKLAKYRVT